MEKYKTWANSEQTTPAVLSQQPVAYSFHGSEAVSRKLGAPETKDLFYSVNPL